MISRILPALLGLAAVAAVAIVLSSSGGDDKYVAYATFGDAGGILKNYNVKIGGVPAGSITDITLDDQDNAVVKMELDASAAPLGEGATAKVRPVNLLGEKYIDLDPGDLSKPMPEGSTIKKDKTAVPVELDDVINVLDPDTRGRLRLLINEAGVAMAGRGADFNKTLDELPRALDSAERVVTDIDDENDALKRAIVSGDRVIGEVNAGRDDLADLVDSAADALETVASRRARLGETVRGAPQALASLRTTLTRLQGASTQLTPAARDLRTASPALAQTLRRAPQFAKDAQETLRTATRVAPRLSKLGRRSTPSLKALRPTAKRLATFTGEIDPFLDVLDEQRGLIDFLSFMDSWADVTNNADGLGHHFRLRITVDDEALTSAISKFIPDLPVKKDGKTKGKPSTKKPVLPALKPTAPSDATSPKPQQPPVTDAVKPVTDSLSQGLQEVGKTVEDAVGDLVGGLVGQGKKDRSGTAGSASSNDTTKLFNYLLGP
ncbi:MCE family protein [Conexibacter sp. W3-3-2]|uniref:MlaD family protein n=1 Tax=Conexibacter sp. W3-3-2 TaxID=2675227 RepID=UPI0012B8180F|nr:MlaD family protein [Conexibacter sp. W3-3-2]MTD45901.1 MCE family protein [Conexibacter sp. W3-3-2]